MKRWIAICSVLALVLGMAALYQSSKMRYGIAVDSVRWLPPEAHNITYFDLPGFTRIAEFDVEQQAFEDWCRGNGKPLHTLTADGWHGEHYSGYAVATVWFALERRGLIPVVPWPGVPTYTDEYWQWVKEQTEFREDGVPTASPPDDMQVYNTVALKWLERMNKRFGKGDLFYEDLWRNGGGYVLGFDVDQGRGYYWYGHH
jgi:hypothetical protein